MKRVFVVLIAMLILAGPAAVQADDMVLKWNEYALETIRLTASPSAPYESTASNPPYGSRALAITQAAVFDSVNSIFPQYTPYKFQVTVNTPTSTEAAVAAAAYTSLAALFPSRSADLTTKYNNSLAGISDGSAKTQGIQLGTQVATNMLTLRQNDGWNVPLNPPYAPTNPPLTGRWQPTEPPAPPANAFLLPQWGYVTPFTMTSPQIQSAPFLQPPPPAISGPDRSRYTTEFNEVKTLGVKTGSSRTPDQTNIAYFWADGPTTETPPGHWNSIAQTVAQSQGTSLVQNARVFALLNLAEGDAAIAAWYMKLTYDFWRPITAIRNAGTDDNPDTVPDLAWEPLLTTPPFPGYVSGHSTFSAAAAAVLAELFGKNVGFRSESDSPVLSGDDKFRTFSSFSQAALEAGKSRIYGGIHFECDNQFGLLAGNELGKYTYTNYLQPVPLPGALTLLAAGLGRILLAVRRRRG